MQNHTKNKKTFNPQKTNPAIKSVVHKHGEQPKIEQLNDNKTELISK